VRLHIIASIAALCAAPCLTAQAQPVTQTYPVVQGTSYKFEKIADGVYYASVAAPGLGSNNVVITTACGGGSCNGAAHFRGGALWKHGG